MARWREPGDGHVCERTGEHCTRCGSRLLPVFDPTERRYDLIDPAAVSASLIPTQETTQ